MKIANEMKKQRMKEQLEADERLMEAEAEACALREKAARNRQDYAKKAAAAIDTATKEGPKDTAAKSTSGSHAAASTETAPKAATPAAAAASKTGPGQAQAGQKNY